jgi:hypothetical protein
MKIALLNNLHYKQNKMALSSFPDRDGLITRRVQQDSFNHEGQCRAVQNTDQGVVQRTDPGSYVVRTTTNQIRFIESCKTQGFPRFPVASSKLAN